MFDPNTYYLVEARPNTHGQGIGIGSRRILATFIGQPHNEGKQAQEFASLHDAEVYTVPPAEFWPIHYRFEEEEVIIGMDHPTMEGVFRSHRLPTGRVVFELPGLVNMYDTWANFQDHLADDSDDFWLMVSVSRSKGQTLTVTAGGFTLK